MAAEKCQRPPRLAERLAVVAVVARQDLLLGIVHHVRHLGDLVAERLRQGRRTPTPRRPKWRGSRGAILARGAPIPAAAQPGERFLERRPSMAASTSRTAIPPGVR